MQKVWALAVMVGSVCAVRAQGPAATANPVLERALQQWPAGKIDNDKSGGLDEGILLDGVIAEWYQIGDGRLFHYVKDAVDAQPPNGIEMGNAVLTLYRVTLDPRYYKAAKVLYDQRRPDGASLSGSFLANYARTFAHEKELNDVASQLLQVDTEMRRSTPVQRGRYAAALIDVLERMPDTDPQRAALVMVSRRVMRAVVRTQDADSGLWRDAGKSGNLLDASANGMLVYALAKGVRVGVLPSSYEANAVRGWTGIQSHFVKADEVLAGANGADGVGAYLLADSEMIQRTRAGELAARVAGKTVLVDAWFNSQKRKTADGNEELFHYKFNDHSNSGFSLWGRMFEQYRVRTEMLDHAPRAEDLVGVAVYVIPSPDIPSLNPKPNYMDKASGDAIEAWVKAGGVLVLMPNDGEHSEFEHFNTLTERFGVHYNAVDRNQQLGADYANTLLQIPAGTGGIFNAAHIALEKDICTIAVSGPAKAVLIDKGDVVMAVAHVGRGWVYANTDPWIYNEYMDGRHLPLGEDNYAAAQELTRWLVDKVPARSLIGSAR